MPTGRHEVQGVVTRAEPIHWVEPSRARNATRHIDRWLVHLVGWIYHIETYQSFVFGLALILFGAVIVATGGFRARSGTSRRSPASVT